MCKLDIHFRIFGREGKVLLGTSWTGRVGNHGQDEEATERLEKRPGPICGRRDV